MAELIHICTHGDGDRFDSPNGKHSACVTCKMVWYVKWPDDAPLPTNDFSSYCYSCKGTRPFSGRTGRCIDCAKPHVRLSESSNGDSSGGPVAVIDEVTLKMNSRDVTNAAAGLIGLSKSLLDNMEAGGPPILIKQAANLDRIAHEMLSWLPPRFTEAINKAIELGWNAHNGGKGSE